MTTKATNIGYWISTVLFAGLMIFSSVDGLKPTEDSIKLIHDQFGYPVYFIQFDSIAKIIGSIVILIPGLGRSIKEWAYAGLFFDLVAVIYSGIAVAGMFDPKMMWMLVWIVPGIASYYLWHKRLKQ